MANPSHPFMLVLMSLVFKGKSLHTLNTNIFSLSNTNTSSFPSLHCVLLLQHFHLFTPINCCAMTPAKGQSSSHRKGKKIVSDSPTAFNVGEGVVYSESDHSDEEEASLASDSECASLIDPWYNIHPHFPKVLGDYTPQPPGCVWLTLC